MIGYYLNGSVGHRSPTMTRWLPWRPTEATPSDYHHDVSVTCRRWSTNVWPVMWRSRWSCLCVTSWSLTATVGTRQGAHRSPTAVVVTATVARIRARRPCHRRLRVTTPIVSASPLHNQFIILLSWPFVSFWAQVNISYRIVSLVAASIRQLKLQATCVFWFTWIHYASLIHAAFPGVCKQV